MFQFSLMSTSFFLQKLSTLTKEGKWKPGKLHLQKVLEFSVQPHLTVLYLYLDLSYLVV